MTQAQFMPGNTIMCNSVIGDDWIRRAVAANPCTAKEDGTIMTGPVRLSFCDGLLAPKKSNIRNDDGSEPTPKYSTSALYPPILDITPLWMAFFNLAKAKFADRYNTGVPSQFIGIDFPIYPVDAEKHVKFEGYTMGGRYANHTSKFKPLIVDVNHNPVDPSRVYPGAWAMLLVNPYDYSTKMKKGISFGVQVVMMIADDLNLAAGSRPDSRKAFGEHITVPSQPPPPPGMLLGNVPGMPPAGAAPGGMPPVPGMSPRAAPVVPQTVYATPGGFAPPPPPNPLHGATGPVYDPNDIRSIM